MKLPKRTPQPTLKTRIARFVLSLQREYALNQSMLEAAQLRDSQRVDSIQGRLNAIQHVLDVLQPTLDKWPSKNVKGAVSLIVNALVDYCKTHGDVPDIETPGEPSEARSERITFKRLSSQVAMLLKDLPEED